ncbi:response regulator, partial [Aliiglaciecola sp.]|nr:response regulator [Aliiglaciecola sp.]
VLKGFCSHWDVDSVSFYSAIEAKKWLEDSDNDTSQLDFLLLDYCMPDMNGLSLLKQVKPYLPNKCKNVLISSITFNQDNAEQVEREFDKVIQKPVIGKLLYKDLVNLTDVDDIQATTQKIETNQQTDNEKQISVLVVEDNQINFMVVEQFLQMQGFQVVWASDGEKALIEFERQPFSLILMDCMMPIMDGYKTTQKIRELEEKQNLNPTPIVALTADITSENKQKCLDAGMNEYITKPFNFEELSDVLKQLI